MSPRTVRRVHLTCDLLALLGCLATAWFLRDARGTSLAMLPLLALASAGGVLISLWLRLVFRSRN